MVLYVCTDPSKKLCCGRFYSDDTTNLRNVKAERKLFTGRLCCEWCCTCVPPRAKSCAVGDFIQPIPQIYVTSRLKENCSQGGFAASGAVRVYRPEQKAVLWAILFSRLLRGYVCLYYISRSSFDFFVYFTDVFTDKPY